MKRAFSFPVLLAALLVVLTVISVRSRFNDPDLWWHLKTGEIIWNTHSIPSMDTFSFTAYGQPWIAQEWLAELTIYGAWKLGGYTGLMLWLSIAASLLIVAAYILCALYSGNSKVAFAGAFITWFFATIGLSIRPQLIGYLFLICGLLVMQLGRSRDSRWFFALPPLFALWINLHGSFILGLAVLAVVLGCSFFEFRCGLLVSQRWERTRRTRLAAAFGLSLATLFINPIGWKLLVYPFDVMLNQQVNLGNVYEWQPPAAGDSLTLALWAVAGLILVLPVLRRTELHIEEIVVLAAAFALASQHKRMLIAFGIVAAPIFCRLLSDAWDGYRPERDRIAPNAVLIGLAGIAVFLAFPSERNLDDQVKRSNPAKALDFIRRSHLSGNMLNEYVYGGYLIWAAPERKVFIDGRADVYEPAGILAEFGRWALLQTDPRLLLEKYRIGYCLLARRAPMAHVLPVMPGWRLVYSDEMASVFVGDRGRSP